MSQYIATDLFDPTREDWQHQLRKLPAPEFRENDDDIRRHIRTLLRSCRARDLERNFLHTLTEDEAMHLFEQQGRRCAITGNALSCLPLQLNTMRCVLHYHTDQVRLPFVCSLDAIATIHPGLPHHRGNVQWTCLRINLGQCGRCSHMFANILTPEQASSCTPTANLGTGLVALCVSWGLL
jgi:hypothetical protein